MSGLRYIAAAVAVALCLARPPSALADEHHSVPAGNQPAGGHSADQYSQMLPMFGRDGVFLGYLRYDAAPCIPAATTLRPAATATPSRADTFAGPGHRHGWLRARTFYGKPAGATHAVSI